MDHRFAEDLLEAYRRGKPFALVTVVETTGSAPQRPGAKMLVFEDGTIAGTVGGGAVEFRLLEEAVESLRTGSATLLRFDLRKDLGMVCGGGMSVFVEPMQESQRVVVFGCGHVCRALVPLLDRLGFGTTVVDDRKEWADPAAFPEGTEVVCEGLLDFARRMEGAERTAVLVMTRSHAFDLELARHFAGKGMPYLGVMASRNKAREFREKLAADGLPAERMETIRMPIGIPIGSTSPDEIAVSIAAELIQLRKQLRKGGGSR